MIPFANLANPGHPSYRYTLRGRSDRDNSYAELRAIRRYICWRPGFANPAKNILALWIHKIFLNARKRTLFDLPLLHLRILLFYFASFPTILRTYRRSLPRLKFSGPYQLTQFHQKITAIAGFPHPLE